MRVSVGAVWFLASLLLSALPIAFFLIGGEETAPLWQENSPIETLSALAYLVGAGAASLGALHSRGFPRLYLILWAAFSILCFGEETSWVQHQLGYDTPVALAELNEQGEFNLHNLRPFHGGALLSDDRGDRRMLALKSQHLFQLGFVAFFLVLPLLVRLRPIAAALHRLNIAYPGLSFAAVVWLPILVTVALAFASAGATKAAVAEIRELVYALAIGSFLTLASARLSRRTP
jgi:hypothetical protein